MKGPAVLAIRTTKKGGPQKGATSMLRRKREYHGRLTPRRRQAVIYLTELGDIASGSRLNVPSIDQQRWQCRHIADLLDVEVIAELVERETGTPMRPKRREAITLAFWEGLDYLIVSSRDRLASDVDDTFEVAWRLGFSHTHVVAADRPTDVHIYSPS